MLFRSSEQQIEHQLEQIKNGFPFLKLEGAAAIGKGIMAPTAQEVYPAHRPPFETAFLFLEDGTPPPEVPPWAMRLILQPEEFESIEQHDRKAPPKG